MDDVEIVDFSRSEGNFMADILNSVYEVIDRFKIDDDEREMFESFIEALDNGHTINFVED